MLPSKGYFSNLSCPFYELDSCDRPHCHFKHSKKDKDVGRVNEIVSAVDATVVDEINANEKNNQLIKELVKETVKQVLSHSEIRESNDSIIDTNTIVDEVVSNLSNQNLNSTVTTANVTSSVQTAAAISSSATPSYRPTPISELSRRHIPVQYAPAKPTTISLSSRKISDKTITYIPSASKTNNSISNNDIMKCSSLNQSVAAYVPAGCEQSYEPEYLPTKIISSESLQRLSDDDEYEISSSPVYNSAADIQPPDSPLTYTPQSSSLSDHIASCSYQPSPIKQHNLIINSDISNDQLENKIKHSASKDEKTGAGDAKQKSINEQCSMKKDKKKCETSDRSNKISSSNKSKSSGKLKEIKHDKDKDFSKSADSSHDSHNKTSSDKVKSKSTSKEHLLKNKSSNDEENKNKRYKESTDRENKSKCLNDEQKRRHKHVKDSAHKSKHSSKSSNVDEKKYKHNRELDRESKFSSSDESKKRKHNQAFDGENKSSSSSGRSSSECHKKKHKQQSSDSETSKVKRNADQLPSASNHPHHKLEKETAKDGSKRLKEECSYSSSSDVELVTEKSPCILINDSSNSSDEETHKDEKKPKLSVSGGSLPYQNLGPSTSRFSLTSSSCSFSERWRKAKEQVQRPHPAGKIKICSVPNVTSLLTAKDKLLAQAHKPSTQPVHSLKFNSSVEEVAQPKAVKQRIAHKQAEELPKCILDPSVKLPYTARQLCLNTMYEVCLQFLLPDEAKELVLTTELDIAKRVNALKTYQNSMALAVLKIRKTKGESKRKEEGVQEGLTAQSKPEYTYGLTMYECFSKYLLSEDEIVQNGYPLAHPTQPGCAYIDPLSRRYTVKQPDDPHLRICLNCKKHYYVDDEGYPTTEYDCFYHHGKLYKVRARGAIIERYRCCQAEVGSDPCELGRYHICSMLDEDCMDDFVTTTTESSTPQIYGLDCEMCYTKTGLELARFTMLGLDGKVVIDTTVLPSSRILDYCTRYSGLTEKIMSTCTTTFDELRAKIMKLIHKNTIIVGHSLENDFKVMKIIHNCVVDTSVVFPHKMGPPVKMALRALVKEHLQLNIQQSEEGHDSKEDALAALDLMIWKVKEDSKKRKPRVIISLDSTSKQSKSVN